MNSESVKISVIIPVYNKARYIEKTITSILNQTYTNFELIIVDDGSTDGSEKICDEYSKKDSRIKVIHIKNGGVSNARNVGISIATGKYIQFIDGDDLLDEHTFEDLICIAENNDSDIVISGFKKVDSEGNILVEILPRLSGIVSKQEFFKEFARDQHTTGIYGWTSCKFIKSKIIRDYNLKFDTNIKLAEDLDFYLSLYQYVENIFMIKYSYFYYLQNAENSSICQFYNNDYLVQINIILKEKHLLEQNFSLNNSNKHIIDKVITNFVLCNVLEKFSWNYNEFKHVLVNTCKDIRIVESFNYEEINIFRKLVLFLLYKKKYLPIYILLSIRKIIEKIYRRIKRLIRR